MMPRTPTGKSKASKGTTPSRAPTPSKSTSRVQTRQSSCTPGGETTPETKTKKGKGKAPARTPARVGLVDSLEGLMEEVNAEILRLNPSSQFLNLVRSCKSAIRDSHLETCYQAIASDRSVEDRDFLRVVENWTFYLTGVVSEAHLGDREQFEKLYKSLMTQVRSAEETNAKFSDLVKTQASMVESAHKEVCRSLSVLKDHTLKVAKMGPPQTPHPPSTIVEVPAPTSDRSRISTIAGFVFRTKGTAECQVYQFSLRGDAPQYITDFLFTLRPVLQRMKRFLPEGDITDKASKITSEAKWKTKLEYLIPKYLN